MATSVLLVGVGALGSHLAYMLRSEDIAWTFVDFDHVEAKNVLAQFHPRSAVRAGKVAALRSTLLAWNPGLQIRPLNVKFSIEQNGETLVRGHDLVIDACDNPEARRELRTVCARLVRPLLHLGVDGAGQVGIVAWDERYTIDPAGAQAATCEGGEHLPMLCRIAAEGALRVQSWLKNREQRSCMVLRDQVVGL